MVVLILPKKPVSLSPALSTTTDGLGFYFLVGVQIRPEARNVVGLQEPFFQIPHFIFLPLGFKSQAINSACLNHLSCLCTNTQWAQIRCGEHKPTYAVWNRGI
nr:PREDICTED: uncharacterized protein LOC106707114 [Latimeria chalumnae]|eukprot:XP_014354440.1 PREDICTED: uncharacterized protein LOC106707114 [Latimeria chalumnae]